MRGILIFFPGVLKTTENFQTFHCPHFWCNASDYSTGTCSQERTRVELLHTKGEYKSVWLRDNADTMLGKEQTDLNLYWINEYNSPLHSYLGEL